MTHYLKAPAPASVCTHPKCYLAAACSIAVFADVPAYSLNLFTAIIFVFLIGFITKKCQQAFPNHAIKPTLPTTATLSSQLKLSLGHPLPSDVRRTEG